MKIQDNKTSITIAMQDSELHNKFARFLEQLQITTGEGHEGELTLPLKIPANSKFSIGCDIIEWGKEIEEDKPKDVAVKLLDELTPQEFNFVAKAVAAFCLTVDDATQRPFTYYRDYTAEADDAAAILMKVRAISSSDTEDYLEDCLGRDQESMSNDKICIEKIKEDNAQHKVQRDQKELKRISIVKRNDRCLKMIIILAILTIVFILHQNLA